MTARSSDLELVRISIVLTCHNRRELTVSCLKHVHQAAAGVAVISVYLVDDGSSDGTTAAVRQEFPDTVVVPGSGPEYWNGGMRLAWRTAIEGGGADFFLWLNDDLDVVPSAISDLLATYARQREKVGSKVIVVGRTLHPITGEQSYGGYAKAAGPSRLRYRFVGPDEEYCYTMHGNCVLLPASVVVDIGINSAHFTHSFGDVEYGFRARRAGYVLAQCQRPVGSQLPNPSQLNAGSVMTHANWRFVLFDPKGVPWREWFYFCREYAGWLWPVNFVYRYLKMVANGLLRRRMGPVSS